MQDEVIMPPVHPGEILGPVLDEIHPLTAASLRTELVASAGSLGRSVKMPDTVSAGSVAGTVSGCLDMAVALAARLALELGQFRLDQGLVLFLVALGVPGAPPAA